MGSLCLVKNVNFYKIDKQDLDALGWTYVDQQIVRTASGDVRFTIYIDKVKLETY
ncbi:hypothetical protein NUACC21_78440 [Scytonema sp. NUACC21]